MKYRYAAERYDSLLFNCPYCGKAVKVHEGDLGRSLLCGECAQEFLTPSLTATELKSAILGSRPNKMVTALALFAISSLIAFGQLTKALVAPAHSSADQVLVGFTLFIALSVAVLIGGIWLVMRGYNWARIVLVAAVALYCLDDLLLLFKQGNSSRLLVLLGLRLGVIYLLFDASVSNWFAAVKRLRAQAIK